MTSKLASFWSRLEGSVHPADANEFARFPDHGFNLDYPPPAFIGDVVNAPILILENNGGFDPVTTPLEFPDHAAVARYRSLLSEPEPVSRLDRCVSPYYLGRNYTQWLVDGVAALVNGVAYRSVSGQNKRVKQLTGSLPSAAFHRRWLLEEIRPLLDRGDRFVIIHRWSRWGDAAVSLNGHPNTVLSKAPVSKDLTTEEMNAAKNYLSRR